MEKSKFGQNFLINNADIVEFTNFCNLLPTDEIIEIGPGNGSLTKEIAKKVKGITAIELDENLAKQLKQIKINNLEVINSNFLDLDLRKIIELKKINKIIGAIPYYISSPIIHKIIKEACSPLNETYLITQKEFAIKVIGEKNKRSYFTNLIERYAKITKGKTINKESFNPIPKVNSMYFKLDHIAYALNINEVENWSKFIHHAFKTPRKKVNKRFDLNLLRNLAINENLRPENLTLKQLEALYSSKIQNTPHTKINNI